MSEESFRWEEIQQPHIWVSYVYSVALKSIVFWKFCVFVTVWGGRCLSSLYLKVTGTHLVTSHTNSWYRPGSELPFIHPASWSSHAHLYWYPLIGREWSHDLNTGLSLVVISHTHLYWYPLIGREWSHDLDTGLSLVVTFHISTKVTSIVYSK